MAAIAVKHLGAPFRNPSVPKPLRTAHCVTQPFFLRAETAAALFKFPEFKNLAFMRCKVNGIQRACIDAAGIAATKIANKGDLLEKLDGTDGAHGFAGSAGGAQCR